MNPEIYKGSRSKNTQKIFHVKRSLWVKVRQYWQMTRSFELLDMTFVMLSYDIKSFGHLVISKTHDFIILNF